MFIFADYDEQVRMRMLWGLGRFVFWALVLLGTFFVFAPLGQ